MTKEEVENNVSEYLNIILPNGKKPIKPEILNEETETNAVDYEFLNVSILRWNLIFQERYICFAI